MESANHHGSGRLCNNGGTITEEKETIAFGGVLVGWSERLEALVERMQPRIGLEAIKNAVETNKFHAYEVYINKDSIGFLITRIDTLLDGTRQFVVVHTLSDVKGKTPLYGVAAVLVNALAKKNACTRICCFADRPAWDGVLSKAGYMFRESIYEKEVN